MTKIVKSADFASVGTHQRMAKQPSNTALNSPLNSPFSGGSLDTLAQPVKNEVQRPLVLSKDDTIKFSKRARSKYLTLSYLFKLIDLQSPLVKCYWSTYHCAGYIEQKVDRLTSKYCNQRWCLTCNRIRIAKAINAYQSGLSDFGEPMFVTLTNDNCKSTVLHSYISEMLKMDLYARRKIKRDTKKSIQGIRKLECTYNPFTDTYNPHFHFIVEGGEQAEMLKYHWIKQNTKAGIKIDKDAQNIKECYGDSMTELFKYFTKLVSSCGGDKRYTTAPALDNIFQSMKGRRVYQPFGGLKKSQVSEEVDTLQADILAQSIGELENDIWIWSGNDWFSQSAGENLSGYNPSEYDKKYGSLIYTKGKS